MPVIGVGIDVVDIDRFVQSLERGLAVIKAFSAAEPELTLSEIARRTGMTRAAARRALSVAAPTLGAMGPGGQPDMSALLAQAQQMQ